MLLFFCFINGLHHGLGADHLMAITALANRGAGRKEVSQLGLRFGLGHMTLLVFLGSLALVLNISVPAIWESRAEIFGGTLLVLLGLWTSLEWLKDAGYIHSHQHSHQLLHREHSHLHFHFKSLHPHQHVHPHFSTVLGALFALSGLRSLLLSAVPILEARSLLWAFLYILLFGLGIIASMTAYAWVAGSALQRHWNRKWLSLILSALSISLGIYWIIAT